MSKERGRVMLSRKTIVLAIVMGIMVLVGVPSVIRYQFIESRISAKDDHRVIVTECDLVLREDGRRRCLLRTFEDEEVTTLKVFLPEGKAHEARLLSFFGSEVIPPVRTIEIPEGIVLELQVGKPGVLELRWEHREGPSEPQYWGMEIERRDPTPEIEGIYHAVADEQMKLDDAIEALSEHIDDSGDPWIVHRARRVRSELLGKRGEPDRAIQDLEAALEDLDEEEVGLRCDLRGVIANMQMAKGELDSAAKALSSMEDCRELSVSQGYELDYYSGELALQQGRNEDAWRSLLSASKGARVLGDERMFVTAELRLAVIYAQRWELNSASESLGRAESCIFGSNGSWCRGETPCDQVGILFAHKAFVEGEYFYSLWSGSADGDKKLRKTIESVEQWTALSKGTSCPSLSASVVDELLLELVGLQLIRGDVPRAEARLKELDDRGSPDRLSPKHNAYRNLLAAEIAAKRGLWTKVEELATKAEGELGSPEEVGAQELLARARLLRGRAAEDRGDDPAARRHYEQSVVGYERVLREVPIGLPTNRTAAKHAEASQRLVALLVGSGTPTQDVESDSPTQDDLSTALCVARLARNQSALRLYNAARRARERPQEVRELVGRVREAERAFIAAERGGTVNEVLRASDAVLHAKREALAVLGDSQGFEGFSIEDRCELLREPGTNELALLYHRGVAEDGKPPTWGVFSWTEEDDSIEYRQLASAPVKHSSSDEQSELLLGPVRERVSGAERVRILASGEVATVPFEGLPWQEEGKLGELLAVTWALDIPEIDQRSVDSPPEDPRPALVTADRYDELGIKDEESEEDEGYTELEKAIEAHGKERVIGYVSGDDASAEDVGKVSDGAAPLVVFTHNAVSPEIEIEGIDNPKCPRSSEISPKNPPPLGMWVNESSIGLDTVLTMPPPHTAVLAGCATALTDELGLGGLGGLANAFVAVGATQVLGTRRIVCTEEELVFVKELLGTQELDLAKALRHLRAKGLDPDVEHRVLVP